MATAMLAESSHDEPSGGIAKWFAPWLLSTASHLAIVLGMLLLFEKHIGSPDQTGIPTGTSLTSIQVIPGGSDGTSSGSQYFDDEDSNVIESPAQAAAAANTGTASQARSKSEFASVFSDEPPVDLKSLLPSDSDAHSSGATNATSTSNGTGFEVPSAAGMIRRGTSGKGTGRGSGTGNGVGDGAGPVGLGNTLEKGKARTGIFGISGEGYKFVYVFDRSGSMDGHGGAPLASAKQELLQSLQNLDKIHQFQIIFYNEHPRIFTPAGTEGRLAFATDQQKMLAERFIGGITADGATRHEDALAMALRLNPDVIFFLTDADEPTLSPAQLAHIARLNNGTTINAIEFGYGHQRESENFLVQLARENSGRHAYVDISQLPRP